jgi:hypothetical protein
MFMVVDREPELFVSTTWMEKLKPVIEANKAAIARGLRKRLIGGIFPLLVAYNVALNPLCTVPFKSKITQLISYQAEK